MTMEILNSASNIINQYQLFLIDIWGVIFDGQKIIPSCLRFLNELQQNNKKIVFISNTPLPSKIMKNKLDNLGLRHLQYNIITSGDMAKIYFNQLAETHDLYYFLGPSRHEPIKTELLISFSEELSECQAIIHTGVQEADDKRDYHAIASEALKHNLKWYCLNPDLYANFGNQILSCAGQIAQSLKDKGGNVTFFGKPYEDIYHQILKSYDIQKSQIICIGDSIFTDVKGAQNLNLSSLLLTSGIHINELHQKPRTLIEKKLAQFGIKPDYLCFLL